MATTIERFALLLEVLGAAQATREIRGLGQASKVAGRETDALESAQNDLTKSLNREKDSLGQVRAAEAKLAELRGDAKAKTSQVVAAEERLAKAQRQSVSASRDVTAAQARLTAEQRRAKDAATDLGKEQTRAAKGVGTAWKVGAGILAAGALAKMVSFGDQAIQSASHLQQSIGGVEAVFGDNAEQIESWSETAASSVGLAKSQFNDFASKLGASLKNAGIEDFAGSTNQLIKLGSDLSATFGGTVSDAIDALGAALRGESDPIERYGVSLNESAVNAELAAKGQDKLAGAALNQAKIQARLSIIFKQTRDAQGQFARESDTLAGKQATASAEAENMRAKLGEGLLPAQLAVTKAFVDMAPALTVAAEGFAAIAENDAARALTLTGVAVIGAAKGVELLGDAADILGLKSDKATRALKNLGVAAAVVGTGVITVKSAMGEMALMSDKTEPSIDNIGKSLDRVFDASFTDRAQDLSGVVGSLFGLWKPAESAGLTVAKDRIDALGKSITETFKAGDLRQGVADFEALEQAMKGAGASQEEINKVLGEARPLYEKATKELAGLVDYFRIGETAAGVMATAVAASKNVFRAFGVVITSVSKEQFEAASAGTKLKVVLDALNGTNRGVLGSNIAYRESLRGLRQTLKENHGVMSLTSVRGLENRKALLAAAEAASEHAQQVADDTGSLGHANKVLAGHREQLIKQVLPYAGSRKAAEKYVDEVLRVPKEVRTKVSTPGSAKSRGEVKSLRLELAKLNDRSVKVGVQFFTNQGHRKGANTGSGIIFAADGGPVPKDMGTPGKDSVPAWLMPGEYVVKKSTVDKYGVDALEHLNAGRYADGGLVAKQLRVAMASRGRPQTMARADRYVTNSAANILSRYTLAGPGAWGAYSPWARTSWTGQTVSQRTAAMLRAVAALTGSGVPLSQGSWSTRVAASAGTHAGGGVVDVSSRAATTAVQSAMRRVGFAAWIRTPSQGPWGRHIHAVAIGDPSLSGPAKRQAASFLGGGSGLARGYDQGGWLPRGLSLAYNGTGRPERVLPPGEIGGVVINGPITVVANDPQALVTALRKEVRLRGGDVQAVLGR